MTRVLRELIDEVRFTKNQKSTGRYSDKRLELFFNSAQREIQRTIFLSNPENDTLSEQATVTIVGGQESYDLPEDIYSVNSVNAVLLVRNDGGKPIPLRKLTYKERNKERGYIIFKNKLLVSPVPQSADSSLLVNYQRKLPNFDGMESSSELPESCEDYLMLFVERKIDYCESSSDISTSQIFTQTEKAEIAELFSEVNQDTSYPPIVDDTYISR